MAMPAVFVDDYRIMGRPYRTARRVMKLHDGFKSRAEAEAVLKRLVEAGELDPQAFVRKQQVMG